MHSITKSLFVGAAITGIGMSSGRADIPLSGETRAWNAAVRKLKPLFEGTGHKLDAERLRSIITEQFTSYARVLSGNFDSFKQLVESIELENHGQEQPMFDWMGCIVQENINIGKEYDRFLGTLVPFERKLILHPSGKQNQGMSFREAELLARLPGHVNWKLDWMDKSVLCNQFNGQIDGISSFLDVINGNKSKKFEYIKEEKFIESPCFILKPGIRKKCNEIINAFMKQLVRWRIYYQITGLHDDTEIEKYHRVLDMLESGKIGKFEYVFGILQRSCNNGKREIIEDGRYSGIRYLNNIWTPGRLRDGLPINVSMHKPFFHLRTVPELRTAPEFRKDFAIACTLLLQEEKLQELKLLFDHWHFEEYKGLEAGNKAFCELQQNLQTFTDHIRRIRKRNWFS